MGATGAKKKALTPMGVHTGVIEDFRHSLDELDQRSFEIRPSLLKQIDLAVRSIDEVVQRIDDGEY